jgi:hypothetical protein
MCSNNVIAKFQLKPSTGDVFISSGTVNDAQPINPGMVMVWHVGNLDSMKMENILFFYVVVKKYSDFRYVFLNIK